jgi:uracil phosphoribosyltransferase
MSIIRDQRTCQADYVRASDRLMAILAEEGIARLPSVKPSVTGESSLKNRGL